MENRSARLWFSDGQVVVAKIIDVAVPDDDDGFVFDVIDADRTQAESRAKNAYWATFDSLIP